MTSKKYLIPILLLATVTGCIGVGDTDGFLPPDINYLKLFEIAKNLISTDTGKNTEALNDFDNLTGTTLGSQVVTWYEAIKLVWSAADALTRGITPRDVRVNQVLYTYKTGFSLTEPIEGERL